MNFKTWPKTIKNVPVPASQQCLQYRGSGYDECVTSNIGGLNFFFWGGAKVAKDPHVPGQDHKFGAYSPPPAPGPESTSLEF